MSYSTIDDHKKILPEETIRQLVDDTEQGLTHAQVLARSNEMRDEADSEIDQYLQSGGYSVPLATVPPMIRGISCDIWAYKMFKRRDVIPEARRTAYRDALAVLKDIRDGKMGLPTVVETIDASFACGALITDHFGDT